MKKKLVSTFLASALLVSTLAGCGFTGGDSGSNTPVSSGDPGTATTTRDTLTYYDSNENPHAGPVGGLRHPVLHHPEQCV